MKRVIQGYSPDAMFRFFEEISAVPRPSGQEERIADYLVNFARERGLEYRRDRHRNVVIKKPASPGRESHPTVMLQAHSDMVCAAAPGEAHDFSREGLELYLDDAGWVRARGTSLGADDGLGMMMLLQALDDPELSHPALECVFTAEEETGLVGAQKLDTGGLEAQVMINLDSGPEGHAIIGCAGGGLIRLERSFKTVPARGIGLELTISGLRSGHSGTCIHLGRANANQLMARLLDQLAEQLPCSIAHLEGGAQDNAIPHTAAARLMLRSEEEANRAEELARELEMQFRGEFMDDDPGLSLSTRRWTGEGTVLSREDSRTLIRLLRLAPNGVFHNSTAFGGYVLSSLNFAVARMRDGQAELRFYLRSARESQYQEMARELRLLGELLAFQVREEDTYPGWPYRKDSPICRLARRGCKEVLGRELVAKPFSAGLECGIFLEKMPWLDIISLGSDVDGCHSAGECMDPASASRLWDLVAYLLREVGRDSEL